MYYIFEVDTCTKDRFVTVKASNEIEATDAIRFFYNEKVIIKQVIFSYLFIDATAKFIPDSQ